MKITIDTLQDSHENLKKVIRMLQSIVGESAYTNSPEALSPESDIFSSQQSTEAESQGEDNQSSSIMSMFGDTGSTQGKDIFSDSNEESGKEPDDAATAQTTSSTEEQSEEPDSDDDLFSDIFSKEELKKVDEKSEGNTKDIKTIEGKPPSIRFYY